MMDYPEDIREFGYYLNSKKAVKKEKDPSEARGIFLRLEQKFRNMEKMGIDAETATDYTENVYECLKMLVEAFMSLDGYKSYSHEATISYSVEFLDFDLGQSAVFNKFRKIRNDISYRGDVSTIDESKQIRTFFISCLEDLRIRFKEKLGD